MLSNLHITSNSLKHFWHIEELLNNGESDVVFSVVPARRSPYFNMVEKRGKHYNKIYKSSYTARQQAPESYELNASIYAYSPRFLNGEIKRTLLEYDCGIVVMPDYLVLDIDSEEDLMLMSKLIDFFAQQDKKLYEILEVCNEII